MLIFDLLRVNKIANRKSIYFVDSSQLFVYFFIIIKTIAALKMGLESTH